MPAKRQLDPYAALPDTSRTQRDDPYADLPDSTAPPDFTTNLKGEGLYRMGTYDYSGGRVSRPEILIPFSRIQDALTSGYKLHPDEMRRYAHDVSHKGKGPSLLERAGSLVGRMTEPIADRPLEWNTGQRTVGSFVRSAPAALSNVGALPINVATRTYRGLAGLPGQTIQTVKGIAHGDPEALESLNPVTMAESEARGYQGDVETLGPTAALANLGGDVGTMYVAAGKGMEVPKRLPMSLAEIKKIVQERIAPTVRYGEGEPTPVDILKKDAGTEDSTRDPREAQRDEAERRHLRRPDATGIRGVPTGQSYTYERRVRPDGGRLRVLGAKVHETWTLDPVKTADLAARGFKSPDIHELDFRDPQAAEAFRASISALKQDNPFAASVHVYDKSEYAAMRMFLTGDGKAGFALKPDGDIISVFSKGPEVKGAAHTMLEIATQAGGLKLDAFDTVLPQIYGEHGFKTVARLPWNDEHAPSGWDKTTFAKFNNGEPDVVFMVYALAGAELYKPGDGRTVTSYDEAVRLQNEAIDDLLGKLRSLYDDWKKANNLTAGIFPKVAQATTLTPWQAAVNGLLKAVATAPRQQSSRDRLRQLQAEAARRNPRFTQPAAAQQGP